MRMAAGRGLEARGSFVYPSAMIIPIDLLVGSEDNVYEFTCASIRRAYQVTITGDEELEENSGKVVSTAIKQILTRKVQFRLEDN